jgi:hypothetical protein
MDLGKKESQIAIIRCYGPAVPSTPAAEGKRPRSVWGRNRAAVYWSMKPGSLLRSV